MSKNFDIRSAGLPARNSMQSAIQIQSNLTCIKHEDKERFKTPPKQSLA